MFDKLLIAASVVAFVVFIGVIYVFLFVPGTPTPAMTEGAQVTTSPPAASATGTHSPTPTPSSTVGPRGSQSAGPSASAGGSQQPTESVPPDIAAQIDAVVSTVPQVRELQPTKTVPYFMVSRDEFATELQSEFDAENNPTDVAAQGRALERLGLLPLGTDLRKFVLDLNGGAVAAFYRPDTGSFYIIERSQPFGPLDRVYVAHEYTHALQDQHFDLEANRIKDPTQGDAALAQLSVIEGDATNTMLLWARENLSVSELIEVATGSLEQSNQSVLDGAPPILERQIVFPYEEGYSFAAELQQQGGWAAVNAAIQHPPASTEQILHPEKYFSHEAPVTVAMPDASADLGTGWSEVYQDTFGEANLQVLVAGNEKPTSALTGIPVWPHADDAAGWAGDRLYMWEGPDNEWAVGWILAWDSPADGDEFLARIGQLTTGFAGPNEASTIKPGLTQLLIASDAKTLTSLSAAVGQ